MKNLWNFEYAILTTTFVFALFLGSVESLATTPCALTNPCPDQFDPPVPLIMCNPNPPTPPPPPTLPPSSPPQDPTDPSPSFVCSSCGVGTGSMVSSIPTYWVSEPFSNLRIEALPLSYSPSHGATLKFGLSYRQRGAVQEDSTVFGFGSGWSSSFRAYLVDLTGSAGVYRVHRGGAGYIDYIPGVPQYRDGSIATSITGGYQIEYSDGSKETFSSSFVNGGGYTLYFLTSRADPTGTAFTFSYSNVGGVFELTSVTDIDGRSTQVYYENVSFPNQVTKVVDPFSRTNLLTYNTSGYLINLVDAAGLTSSFQYDSTLWQLYGPSLTNMVTPYGATAFTFGGVIPGLSTLTPAVTPLTASCRPFCLMAALIFTSIG